MSPIRRFDNVRVGVEELSVYRRGMKPPKVGDIIERDYAQVRVTRVLVRASSFGERIDRELGARPDLGDFMVRVEYEPLA